MPMTNRLGLPGPLVKALEKETYNPGHGDFSATELIAPPKVKVLEKRHRHEIFEDAADKLYSLYGQITHLILERAGVGLAGRGYQVEQRHYAQYGRWNVSAQFDCLDTENGVLSDYKFTTAYSAQTNMDGKVELKKEWFAQLNIQADILRKNPQLGLPPIHTLQIVALLRDWQPSKAAQDMLYPQSKVVVIPIPMVGSERVEKYVLERCELHQRAKDEPNDDLIPECSKEDRWEDETKFAAMKKGGKRATKVFDSEADAWNWINQQKDAKDFQVDTRQGFARRCMGVGESKYCNAAAFCHHHRMLTQNLREQAERQPQAAV
jgi:hypothetical protein